MSFLLELPIFRGCVKFPGCNCGYNPTYNSIYNYQVVGAHLEGISKSHSFNEYLLDVQQSKKQK